MGDILRGAHKVKRIGCPHLKKVKREAMARRFRPEQIGKTRFFRKTTGSML